MLQAAGELFWGSLDQAERYLTQAERGLQAGGEAPVPAERPGRAQVLLGIVRLWLARLRGDLAAVAEQADRLLGPAETPDGAQLGLSEDVRALAVVTLGVVEAWAGRLEDADRHLDQGVALARRIGRPYLELLGLATGPQSQASGPMRSESSAADRRSSWPTTTAGTRNGPPGSPTRS